MKAGEFPDGARTAARQDRHGVAEHQHARPGACTASCTRTHHRTGDAWCIYPMYDYAHGLSRLLEGITHSICTLEFENHRPLYDWFVDSGFGDRPPPQQIEFARLNLDLHGDEQAQAAPAGRTKGTSPAGTTRACRPSPACAAAATRPRRSATSASGSASPRTTASIDIGAAGALHARRPEQPRAARAWPCSSR